MTETSRAPDLSWEPNSETGRAVRQFLEWYRTDRDGRAAWLDSLRASDSNGDQLAEWFEAAFVPWLEATEIPRDFGAAFKIGRRDEWDLRLRLTQTRDGVVCHSL